MILRRSSIVSTDAKHTPQFQTLGNTIGFFSQTETASLRRCGTVVRRPNRTVEIISFQFPIIGSHIIRQHQKATPHWKPAAEMADQTLNDDDRR